MCRHDTAWVRCLVDAVERVSGRGRVVEHEGSVGTGPDRRCPLVTGHGPLGQGGQSVAQVVPGEAGGLRGGDDRNVCRLDVRSAGRVGGIGVHRVAVVEAERVSEVAVVDRLAVEQPTEGREFDALGLGGVDADGAFRGAVAGRDERLPRPHRRNDREWFRRRGGCLVCRLGARTGWNRDDGEQPGAHSQDGKSADERGRRPAESRPSDRTAGLDGCLHQTDPMRDAIPGMVSAVEFPPMSTQTMVKVDLIAEASRQHLSSIRKCEK